LLKEQGFLCWIKEIIDEEAKIVLLPRPRRFGKTLNLSMLRRFFEISDSKEVMRGFFKGLAIEKEDDFEKHFATYPVIFLTFKDIKSREFDSALNDIKRVISDQFRRHAYLLKSDALDDIQKKEFHDVMTLQADRALFNVSLNYLSEYLYLHHKSKPVILIDEYDTPIHTAYTEGYHNDMTAFFRAFLGAGLNPTT